MCLAASAEQSDVPDPMLGVLDRLLGLVDSVGGSATECGSEETYWERVTRIVQKMKKDGDIEKVEALFRSRSMRMP